MPAEAIRKRNITISIAGIEISLPIIAEKPQRKTMK
jgi:hypothetical protein